MPELLIFAPCEKVLISGAEAGDNSSTLVSILDSLVVKEDIPDDAVMPMKWDIFALWTRTDKDAGVTYEQICQVVLPSGKRSVESALEFAFTKRNQRNTVHIVGLPIGEAGEYALEIYLQKKGQPKTRKKYGSYPLVVEHAVSGSPKKRAKARKKRKSARARRDSAEEQ